MEETMSAREIWYATDHILRHMRWAEKERRRRNRILKRAHRDWLYQEGPLRTALDKVRKDSLGVYKRAQSAWW